MRLLFSTYVCTLKGFTFERFLRAARIVNYFCFWSHRIEMDIPPCYTHHQYTVGSFCQYLSHISEIISRIWDKFKYDMTSNKNVWPIWFDFSIIWQNYIDMIFLLNLFSIFFDWCNVGRIKSSLSFQITLAEISLQFIFLLSSSWNSTIFIFSLLFP